MINLFTGGSQIQHSISIFLNSLRNEDNTNKNMDISTNFDELVNHFQSQGEPESFNLDFKKRVDEHILKYKKILNYNEKTDEPPRINEIEKCIRK